jgi:acyl-CoA thioesterase II
MNLEESTRLDGSDGKYSAQLSPDWAFFAPNGGHLAALALRAVGMVAEIRKPSSLYCHFLSVPKFERVDLEVAALKRGKRAEFFSVSMRQQDKLVLQAMVRTTSDAASYDFQELRAPQVPMPESLKSGDELWANTLASTFKFWENVEARPVRQTNLREPDAAIRRDWLRFRPQATFEDPFVDAARPLILLDTYGWPAVWQKHPNDEYVAPNLDTSIWLHRMDSTADWLLVDHECVTASDGLIGVSGKVWDRAGNLIATGSAHLCFIPTKR